MHRIDTDGNVSNLFDSGDPAVPRNPTQVDAAWLNCVQEEICNVISSGLLTTWVPSKTTLTQLRDGILGHVSMAITTALRNLQIVKFTPLAGSGAQINASEGDVYYDSGTHKLMIYNGSAWVVVGSQS